MARFPSFNWSVETVSISVQVRYRGKQFQQRTHDIRHNVGLVQADAENLSLLVDSNDTASQFVLCRSKDGVSRDTVHVKTLSSLQVVQMDETILGDEVDDSVAFRNLHRDREIVDGLGREENIGCLLLEDRVRCVVIDLDDVKLHSIAR